MPFNTFSLHPKILKAVAEAGYTQPTEVQILAIPKIMAGADLRTSAQTGTGKTAAFVLPCLNRLTMTPQKPGKGPRVLILVPTRELAMQIAEHTHKYSKYLQPVKTVCVFGGVPFPEQIRQLSRPYDILIATPGRLIDFISRGKISFGRLEMLILDEADRMLDMGFVEPVESIVEKTPKSRQTLLFSATLKGSVMQLSEKLLNNPEEIVVHAEHAKHDNIEQRLHYTDNLGHKNRLLDHILKGDDMQFAIVFSSSKRHVDQLVDELHDKGFQAGGLHGDMNQRERTRTLTKLRTGKIKILVATDVAARGLDVRTITHVINFDLPHNVEDYVHRIGRTGRGSAKGTALSFASTRDTLLVKRIEKFTGHPINVVEIPGLEPQIKPNRPKNPRPFRKGKGRPFPRKKRFSR